MEIMADLKFDFSNREKVQNLLDGKPKQDLKMSTKYFLDDEYIINPSLTFNFAQNVFTSTVASVNKRYNADSCLKTKSSDFAKKVVDHFMATVPQPRLDFHDFYLHCESKIQKKLKDFVRTKQYKSFNDISDDEFTNITNWFVKEQFKFDAKPQLKEPQGIIAWSKTKNLIYLSMVKYVEYYFDENKDHYFMPAKYPPEAFKAHIKTHYKSHNKTTATDASGYDRTQNGTSLLAEMEFYKRVFIGPLNDLLYKYFKNRERYVVIGEFLNLLIDYIKASGEPGTIDMNSLWKKLSCFYIFDIDWKSEGAIYIQGDDDMINKVHSLNKERYEEMLRYVDLSLKFEYPKIPEFAGKIIYEEGFIPDLWRTAQRIFCKTNTKHFYERFDFPINNRYFTEYERQHLKIDKKDTYLRCLQVSAKDLIKDITFYEIEVLNKFYDEHKGNSTLGTLAYEHIKFFSLNRIESIL